MCGIIRPGDGGRCTTLPGRAAQAAEIAQAITFLASLTSAYVTSTAVAADGGRITI